MEKNDVFFIEAKKMLDREKYEDAIKIILPLTKKEPTNFDYIYALARAYLLKGEIEAARPVFEKIIKLIPDFELASFGLFLCYFSEKKLDMAFDEMIRFISKYSFHHYRECVKDCLSTRKPFPIKTIFSE